MTYRELAIWQEEDGQIRHKALLTISSLTGFLADLLKHTPYEQVWNLDTDGDWFKGMEDSFGVAYIEIENVPSPIKLYALMLGNWSEP